MFSQDFQRALLAPCTHADIGIAAVNHGADAVYVGGSFVSAWVPPRPAAICMGCLPSLHAFPLPFADDFS